MIIYNLFAFKYIAYGSKIMYRRWTYREIQMEWSFVVIFCLNPTYIVAVKLDYEPINLCYVFL